MDIEGLLLLEKALKEHPNLKVEDHTVVTRLCGRLAVEGDPGMINNYIRDQIDAEAMAVYLYSRYTALVSKLDSIRLENRADCSFELGSRDDEGLKWTKSGKEEYLLATNTKYLGQVVRLRMAEDLLLMVKGLYSITFSRDRKLEQLSVNYRRELEGDNRT